MSVKKSIKVTTHDKPTTLNIPDDQRHCPSDPSSYDLLPYKQYYLINIKKGNSISDGGFVQAVERNGKCTLILGGTNPYSENSKNNISY